MSATRKTPGSNRPEASARVIAALIAHDGRLDWRELEFLDGAGTLEILGIEHGRFMAVLSRYLAERRVDTAAWRSTNAERFDAALDAIDDRDTQLILAAALLYLTEIDGVRADERFLVRRAWDRWNVTPQVLERTMNIPLALSRSVYGLAAS